MERLLRKRLRYDAKGGGMNPEPAWRLLTRLQRKVARQIPPQHVRVVIDRIVTAEEDRVRAELARKGRIIVPRARHLGIVERTA